MHEAIIRGRDQGSRHPPMISTISHDLRNWLLKPPFRGVVWTAWLYVAAASLYAGGGPFSGDLVWFDDRVRLVQIFNWLNGAAWHDRTIMRVNAPDGFHTIWSRIFDLPAAGIIAICQNFVSQMQAGMIASIIVPLAQVLLLFFAASYFAQPLVGKKSAKLVTLFVLFASAINPEYFTLAGFHVGMIGHHPWYVLFTLMLFGASGRLVLGSSLPSIVIAGLSLGGLLAIGIEGLPLIAGICALIASLGWLHNNLRLIADAAKFTFIGAIISLALLPANQPFDKILSVSFAEPSILGPLLAATAALFFTTQFLIARTWGQRKIISAIASVCVAGAIVTALLHWFPDFLQGGAAALTPEERHLAATEHTEAQSLFHVATDTLDYLRILIPPLIASAYALYRLSGRQTQRQQTLTLYYFGLVLLCFGMASVYSRYYHYATLAVCPWLLLLWLNSAKAFARDDYYALKNFLLYVALGPLWLWLVPAAHYNHSFQDTLLFPAKLQTKQQVCATRQFTDFLNQHYNADKTIISPLYFSDRFLLHTHLQIFFLANFPSHNKFIEAKAFYETHDPAEAKKIAAQHGIDLVAVCRQHYPMPKAGGLADQLLKNHISFGRMLVSGQIPDWIRPVDIAADTPWLLFEVDKSKLSPQSE